MQKQPDSYINKPDIRLLGALIKHPQATAAWAATRDPSPEMFDPLYRMLAEAIHHYWTEHRTQLTRTNYLTYLAGKSLGKKQIITVTTTAPRAHPQRNWRRCVPSNHETCTPSTGT